MFTDSALAALSWSGDQTMQQNNSQLQWYARLVCHCHCFLQVECHPYFRNEDMLQWCKSNQIHVTAYSPLGSPDSASMFKRKAPLLLQDPAVGAVANKMGRSPAQVYKSWSQLASMPRSAYQCKPLAIASNDQLKTLSLANSA